jgi:thymidylate synthase
MAHQVARRHPLDSWEELVVRCVRFGRPVMLRDGPRLELLNVKVIIAEPLEEQQEILGAYGFDLGAFTEYQRRILQPCLPADAAYTYGNRMGGYFERDGIKLDTLQTVIAGLIRNPENRRSYIALWDTTADLDASYSDDGSAAVPCLTTIFFRKSEDRLSLTATFRSHNLLTAWLENVYGLIAIQRHVAAGTGMASGPITVISHSLGIDPRSDRYPLAQAIADGWKGDEDLDRAAGKRSMHEDPSGYFVVSVDYGARRIVADHMFAGVLIRRYQSAKAARIERAVIADMAISQVSHALWLGRELAAKEQLLRDAPTHRTQVSGC